MSRNIPARARAGAAVAVVAGATLLRAFGASASSEERGAPPPSRTVVLVALDGVRWQDVFEGVDPALATEHGLSSREVVASHALVPNLHRLSTREGAAIGALDDGPAMVASGPNFVSLPGYMEMLTGAVDPGCRDNECGRTRISTVADDVASNWKERKAAVLASWPGVERACANTPGTVAVSVGRTAGATRRRVAATARLRNLLQKAEFDPPAPGQGDFRRDAHTADIAIEYLQSQRPRFLFVGFGETDEYGHAGNYPAYLRALSEADARIGRIWEVVRALTRDGHAATLLVTTDHGRGADFRNHGAQYPESARVWLVAAGSSIAARGRLLSPQRRRLADVAMTVRRILGLAAPTGQGLGQPLRELFSREPARPLARSPRGPGRPSSHRCVHEDRERPEQQRVPLDDSLLCPGR